MNNPQNLIEIGDDSDAGSPADRQRSRSVSVVSSASSHTLRASSPEPETVHNLDRLSVQPPTSTKPSYTRLSEVPRSKRPFSNLGQQDANLPNHRPFHYHRIRNGLSSQDPPVTTARCGSEIIHQSSIQPSPAASRTQTLVKDNVSNNRAKSTSTQMEGENAHYRDKSGKDQAASGLREGHEVFIDLVLDEPEVKVPRFDKDKHELMNLDDFEAELEVEFLQEREVPRDSLFPRVQAINATRSTPIALPVVELENYEWNGKFLISGKTVELSDGSFLKIRAVTQNLETDEVMLRGWRLKRNREMGGMLPLKVNELYFVLEIDLDDPRPSWEQSIIEVGLNYIMQIRKLVCTNRPFPECRFDQRHVPNKYFRSQETLKKYLEEKEVLIARRKFTTTWDTARDRLQNPRKLNNFREKLLETLNEKDCSEGCHLPAHLLRYRWRGNTILGGSGTQKKKESAMSHHGQLALGKSGSKHTLINLIDDSYEENPSKVTQSHRRPFPNPRTEQVYTYGDSYSGAGGTMRGALMANLKLKWGLDFDADCCSTLCANFPEIEVFEKWVHQFVAMPDPQKKYIVDIFHLSPPCQFFALCKTRAGKNDEMNYASLFGVQELIKKARPRIVTLEQTFGILCRMKFINSFNQLIRMFIDNGFSVSWQAVDFERFGLAQHRKRLIIVAACPGETLPEFPSYTHNENGSAGLKKYTSVRKVLNDIPRNASQHDIRTTHSRRNYYVWDDSSIINCITTNGGDYNCHPSGQRALTYREYAALQGFPHEHFFTGNSATTIKRQIGNAVPPNIAKIIFENIRKHLEKVDRKEKRDFIITEGQ